MKEGIIDLTNNIEQLPPEEALSVARDQIHAQQSEAIARQQETLVDSPEVRRLIGDVGGLRDIEVDTEYEDFEGLHRAMGAVFDFRTKADGSYGERWEAEENAKAFLEACNEDIRDRIYSVAEAFGLTGDTVPSEPEAEALVILGGGGKSPIDRTMYSKELVDSGRVQPHYIVALGSGREVDAAEIERAGSYAAGAKTEFDLLLKAAEHTFGATVKPEDIISWKDQQLDAGIRNEVKVAMISATDSHPAIYVLSSAMVTNPYRVVAANGEKTAKLRPRSNTSDTFAAYGWMADFHPGDKVVAVTNAHFKPFQGADAAGLLAEYGVMTEVVGFDPKHFGNPPKRPDELLQEMLTTAGSLLKARQTVYRDSEATAGRSVIERQRRLFAQQASRMLLDVYGKKVA